VHKISLEICYQISREITASAHGRFSSIGLIEFQIFEYKLLCYYSGGLAGSEACPVPCQESTNPSQEQLSLNLVLRNLQYIVN